MIELEKEAPDFTLKSSDGNDVSLSDFKVSIFKLAVLKFSNYDGTFYSHKNIFSQITTA